MGVSIGVDIGGTKIAAGVVDDGGAIIAREHVTTPATQPDAIADAVASAVRRLLIDHPVTSIGVGAAGFVDAARRTVLFAPNINWVQEPLAEHVEKRIGLPVVVENDANAATWGEFRFGAGKDVDDLLLVTIGTGIGGGIVTDGQLQRGAFGVAGEIGHMRVVPGGVRCGCGNDGCWESYASGRALVRQARARLDADDDDARPLATLLHDDPDALTGPMVTQEAAAGDPMCTELLSDLGRWVGEGVASLACILDPSVVAIGGGVSAAGELLMEPARQSFRHSLSARRYRPLLDLRVAALGNDAGMIGAADLARGAG